MAPAPRPRPRPTTLLAALLWLLAPCSAVAQPGGGAEFGSDWILERLARAAPERTGFVELRESKLLKAPMRVSGEYRRPASDVLVRQVQSPYVETTTLRDGEATVARAGRAPRTFALSRAPELAALQAGFGALLAGDRATLERHFAIRTQGVRERWTMTLVAQDEELAARLRRIVLHGRGAELRCIETEPTEGATQRTLLAGAAAAAAPQADAAALAALCHGGSGG